MINHLIVGLITSMLYKNELMHLNNYAKKLIPKIQQKLILLN